MPNDFAPFQVGPITLSELEFAIKKAKLNKAPGPDMMNAELFKLLDNTNKSCLLAMLNHRWQPEEIPEHHLEAQVVTIYKKGATDNIANYRPISLLNII